MGIRLRPRFILILWLFVICGITGIMDSDVPMLLSLNHHHKQATGKVLRMIPNSHGTIEVSYFVSGMKYQRSFFLIAPGQLASDGTVTTVYYSPEDPETSCIGPPADILEQLLHEWILFALLITIFFFVILTSMPRTERSPS